MPLFLKRSAFTLIEVIIVTAILAVLAVFAVGYYQDIFQDAREATVRTNLKAIRSALANYFKQNMEYPTTFTQLGMTDSIQRLTIDKLENANAEIFFSIPDVTNPDVTKRALSPNPIHVPVSSMTLEPLGSAALVGKQFNDVKIKISGQLQAW